MIKLIYSIVSLVMYTLLKMEYLHSTAKTRSDGWLHEYVHGMFVEMFMSKKENEIVEIRKNECKTGIHFDKNSKFKKIRENLCFSIFLV